MNIKRIVSLAFMSFLSVGTISASVALLNKEEVYIPSFATYENHDAATYYQGVDDTLEGNDLLSSLRSLNNTKRKSQVGYDAILYTAGKYTDYDPEHVEYDSNGQPYSDYITGFYSGTVAYKASGMNREHVWPDSRGGNYVEKDVHMPRPTIQSENGSRGNSFFVEGMKSSSGGWDPAMESFGDETYRGDSARITFYSVVASNMLSLVDKTDDSTGNHTMGKLSDLIKWHLSYPISERENNRNEGAEYLQGNRNPFIDHPEYVCRIWGNTNEATKALCANDPYEGNKPESITLNKEELTIALYETSTLSVASVTPSEAAKDVTWSTSNDSVVTVSKDGLIQGKGLGSAVITATSTRDKSVKATCSVTVVEPSPIAITDIEVDRSSLTIDEGDVRKINVTTVPSFIYPFAAFEFESKNTTIAVVDGEGNVTGVKEGTTQIVVKAKQGDITKTATVDVTVTHVSDDKLTPITATSQLKEGDKVVLAQSETAAGISGKHATYSNTAGISDDLKDWRKFTVENYSSSGFCLYDAEEQQYIDCSETSNVFYYQDTGGLCNVTSQGYLTCHNRFLVANGQYNRFYASVGSYTPFYIYKIGGSVVPDTGTLESISISLYTAVYDLNDEFSFDGVCVANYSNSQTKQVTPTFVTEPDMTTSGDKTIVVKYKDGDIEVQTSYTITVKPAEAEEIKVTGIALSETELEMDAGDTYTLAATVSPNDATNKNITWESSDSSVASVNDGVVTAREGGIVTITAVTLDGGFSTSCTITINEKPIEPSLVKITVSGPTKTTYNVGETFDPAGLNVVAHYDNDSTKPIETGYTLSDVNLSTAGEKEIIVSYEGKTDKFTLTIVDPTISVKNNAKRELNSYYASLNLNKYSDENKAKLAQELSKGISAIDAAADISGVNSALANAKAALDAVPQNQSSGSSCGGNIVATSAILSALSLVGIVLVVIKKRKVNG
ncbi:MAG: Ig-like domain-containing protein [Bacilli bacterium]|nr:Ig-like domain-containing protein [Bacilli bacterium]